MENKQVYQQNTPLLMLFFHTQKKKKTVFRMSSKAY
jgi:hypothetical protein